MIQNNEYKKSDGGNRSDEAEMRKALKEIIRLVEGWVDSDERKAEEIGRASCRERVLDHV